MPKIESWEKKLASIVSIILGVAIVVTAFMTLWGKPLFDEYILFAVVITVFPSAVLDYVDYRWRKSVDEHLPDLFRSIAQAQKTGMNLAQALEEAAKRSYGLLTGELKKIVAQISWGLSFERALHSFGKRIDTVLTRRSVPLVIEASRCGGRVEKVFTSLGSFIQRIQTFERERQAQMRPYIAIFYVAFFVFIFTVVILFKAFFVQLTGLPVMWSVLLTPEEARRIFFHMSTIQAFFGGLVAGKMGEGTISAGLKHSVILLTSGYLVFKFIV